MNTPAQIAENYVQIGAAKTRLTLGKLFVLAVLAGAFIALAGVSSAAASAAIQNPSAARLVSACVFPAGLAMVLVAGSELFTGNCLLVIPLLEKACTLRAALRNLAVVYLGNLAGSLLVAAAVVGGHSVGAYGGALAASMIGTAAGKCSLSFGDALIRGILCNVLVCVAVWMSFAAKTAAGKIACLFLPIMAFVAAGYEHCVADMYYVPAGLLARANPAWAAACTADLSRLTWGGFFTRCLLPVSLGNLIGGVLVGLAYWYAFLHGAVKAVPVRENAAALASQAEELPRRPGRSDKIFAASLLE